MENFDNLNEEPLNELLEDQPEKPSKLIRTLSILFVVAIYSVIFLKILILK